MADDDAALLAMVRDAHGITEYALAPLVGTTHSLLYAVGRGERRLPPAVRILCAQLLRGGITITDLEHTALTR